MGKNISLKTGDKYWTEITYKNIGSTPQSDIYVFNQLPNFISYIPGSSYLNNSSEGPHSIADGITTSGIDLNGTYLPGANAYIIFEAKVGEIPSTKLLNNFSMAIYGKETQSDYTIL